MKTLRRIRDNSARAFAGLHVAEREALVLSAYRLARAPQTDREIATALGFADLNAVRPRITELIARRLLREIGDAKCAVTGMTVRTCMPTKRGRA